ncbi:esterase E4-like isoform X4 [Planococcus citri]|uniref:esterase E4-like isoform X4 n=1 Tax=Planococcus citri TaxID=170843 RepID=UPI0031F86551
MGDKFYITVNEGKIKGIKKTSIFSGVEYYSFLGVPYAQPPVGNARFKDPVRIKPWTTTFDATVEKEGCRHFSVLKRGLAGSEDCLYNNIHVSKIPNENEPLKAVIVNIHPGGFFHGSADPSQYGSPDFVIHHDIVYICISYRLHILGFLNLGLKECSGNQGLKDIIMSLEWIRDNAIAFGGDPNNVTIMGSSSGSALVNALMISPRAKGLFHKAVLMGMYVLNPALITLQENASIAFEIAQSLGYEGAAEERKKLLSFFKKIPIEAVIVLRPETLLHKVKMAMFPASPFVPTSDTSGENPVLPISLKDLVPSTTRIPIMVGFCEKEAVMVFLKVLKSSMAKNFYSTVTQNVWGWGHDLTEEDLKLIKEQAEQFYLNGEPTERAALSDRCEIQTDMALSDAYDSLINIIARDLPSSAYVYRFDFEGSIPTIKERIMAQLDEPLKGTAHADDYSYWSFVKDHLSKMDYNMSPKTHEMVEKFTKLICTFAKTGNPNYEGLEVEWKPSSIENPHYLSINDPLTSIEGKLNGKRMEFWENLKKQFTNE